MAIECGEEAGIGEAADSVIVVVTLAGASA